MIRMMRMMGVMVSGIRIIHHHWIIDRIGIPARIPIPGIKGFPAVIWCIIIDRVIPGSMIVIWITSTYMDIKTEPVIST
jgi:hypothetical protein